MTGSHSTPRPKPSVSTDLYQVGNTIDSPSLSDSKRVVFKNGDEGLRYQDLNAIYKSSNYNKDIAMVVFLETMRDKKKYESYRLRIRGQQGELGMCQAMPFWFTKYPNIFNEEYLTDLDAQIAGCLRLRDRAWRGDNFVGTRPLTYPARHRALEFIEFVE